MSYTREDVDTFDRDIPKTEEQEALDFLKQELKSMAQCTHMDSLVNLLDAIDGVLLNGYSLSLSLKPRWPLNGADFTLYDMDGNLTKGILAQCSWTDTACISGDREAVWRDNMDKFIDERFDLGCIDPGGKV